MSAGGVTDAIRLHGGLGRFGSWAGTRHIGGCQRLAQENEIEAEKKTTMMMASYLLYCEGKHVVEIVVGGRIGKGPGAGQGSTAV
jgi:hypothetical protein